MMVVRVGRARLAVVELRAEACEEDVSLSGGARAVGPAVAVWLLGFGGVAAGRGK